MPSLVELQVAKKMLRKFLSLFLIFCYFFSFAEIVTVNKPGGLEKAIKKNKLTNTTDLTIQGKLNLQDIYFLENLPNLKSLNFDEVELIPQNKNENVSRFRLPSLPNLESLRLSDTFGREKTIILGLIPNLKKLSTSKFIKLLNIQPDVLDFLEVVGEPGISFNKSI